MVSNDGNNAPNRDELYRLAVDAAKKGQKQPARMMFQQVLAQDPKNERVLLWMAKLSNNPDARRKWLERVLDVNPHNETALKIVSQMEHRGAADRNRALMRIGVGVYVVALTAISFLIMLTTLSITP